MPTNYYAFGFDIGLDSIACAIVENGVVIYVTTIMRSKYIAASKAKGQVSRRVRYESYYPTLGKVARAARRVYNGKFDKTESNVGVFIETPFLGVNPRTFRALARVEGEVIGEFERVGVPTSDVKPSEWQKDLLGVTKPRSLLEDLSKEEAARALKFSKSLRKRVLTVHEADAINIARFGYSFDHALRATFESIDNFRKFGRSLKAAQVSLDDLGKSLVDFGRVIAGND